MATGSIPATREQLTSGGGELNSRPKITESHSRSTAFKSDDRMKVNNSGKNGRNGNAVDGDISVGSRGEHLPPQTEKPGHVGLNDSMEKASGLPHVNDRNDYRTNNSQEIGGAGGAGDKDDGERRPNVGGGSGEYDSRLGKHVHSSNDVTSSNKRNAP